MGHFFEWGKYNAPSNLEREALMNAAFKNGLTFVEIIDDPTIVDNIRTNFNDLYLWSVENLEGGWTVINNPKEKIIAFYFSSEEDQVGFKLAWG